MRLIVLWLTLLINTMARPGRPPRVQENKVVTESVESVEEAQTHHERLATALARVVYDPDEKPLFGGKRGRARTATLMLSIVRFESGFWKDVALATGEYGRGDHGNSWGYMQFRLGKKLRSDGVWDSERRTPEGHTARELIEDPEKMFRDGLHAVRRSMGGCRMAKYKMTKEGVVPLTAEDPPLRVGPLDGLSAYATGKCIAGEPKSRQRMNYGDTLFSLHRAPLEDARVHGDDPPEEPTAKNE